jgi:hypothetical protein
MTYTQPLTTCERMGNTCPSKRNCHRHEMPLSMEYTAAALNMRRLSDSAGATACDMVEWINKPPSTFVEIQVAEAFGIDPDRLQEVV